MSKLLPLYADDGQYVYLYLLEIKIGYMELKTIEEDVSVCLSFDPVLAKSNIDFNTNVFEMAIQKKTIEMKTELCWTFTIWSWRTTVNYNNKANHVDI